VAEGCGLGGPGVGGCEGVDTGTEVPLVGVEPAVGLAEPPGAGDEGLALEVTGTVVAGDGPAQALATSRSAMKQTPGRAMASWMLSQRHQTCQCHWSPSHVGTTNAAGLVELRPKTRRANRTASHLSPGITSGADAGQFSRPYARRMAVLVATRRPRTRLTRPPRTNQKDRALCPARLRVSGAVSAHSARPRYGPPRDARWGSSFLNKSWGRWRSESTSRMLEAWAGPLGLLPSWCCWSPRVRPPRSSQRQPARRH
jgi:hypothetical protein